MAELETRELEYFVAVAEDLHFGRAAQRLMIAQPALSKAIRRLESRLGVELLARTSRSVALTPAGAALLEQGRHVLNAVSAAATAARRAAVSDPTLRLVIKPGGDANLLSGILAAYGHQPDAHRVDVIFGGNTDRADHLRDGRADLALLYAPFDDLSGLEHITLLIEGRVAILPRSHRLATCAEVTLADLQDEPQPRWIGVDPDADDLAGTGSGPEVADLAQMLQLIALGRMVAMLPRSLVSPVPAGVVCVPVIDAPTSRIVLAWSAGASSPQLMSFVDAARVSIPASTTLTAPWSRSPRSNGAGSSSIQPSSVAK